MGQIRLHFLDPHTRRAHRRDHRLRSARSAESLQVPHPETFERNVVRQNVVVVGTRVEKDWRKWWWGHEGALVRVAGVVYEDGGRVDCELEEGECRVGGCEVCLRVDWDLLVLDLKG